MAFLGADGSGALRALVVGALALGLSAGSCSINASSDHRSCRHGDRDRGLCRSGGVVVVDTGEASASPETDPWLLDDYAWHPARDPGAQPVALLWDFRQELPAAPPLEAVEHLLAANPRLFALPPEAGSLERPSVRRGTEGQGELEVRTRQRDVFGRKVPGASLVFRFGPGGSLVSIRNTTRRVPLAGRGFAPPPF